MPARTSAQVITARERLEAGALQRVEADGDARAVRPRAIAVACAASSTPLVVIARSSSVPIAASRAVRSATCARSSGSPPVSRTCRTPSPAKTRVTRVSSSKVSSVVFGSHT